MGEAPDELNVSRTSSSHVDEAKPIPFPSGTARQVGDVNWQPSDTPVVVSASHDEARDESEDLHEIREDIEHTRAELSETIDEIQERLAPQHLVAQAKEAALGAGSNLVEDTKAAIAEAAQAKADEYIGKAERIVTELSYTARDTSDSMLDTIKGNPLPTAVAVAGLGWLFMRRRHNHNGSRMRSHSYTGWTDTDYPRAHYVQRTESGGIGGHIDRVQDKAGDVVDRAKGSIGDVADFAGALPGTATDMAGDVADRAGHMATSAGSTAMDAGTGFWDMVRRNPVPATLAGVGLAWMWMNRDEPRIRPVHTVSSTIEPVGDIASNVKGQVGDVADRAMSQVGNVADRAKDQIGGLGDTAQHQAYRARTQLDRLLEDAPLAVGAAALAIGAAIGLALPSTSRERELMGDAREQLMDRTQQFAHQAQERLMQVAEEVKETAKSELQTAQSDMSNGTLGTVR
jgi:hypothetical protein